MNPPKRVTGIASVAGRAIKLNVESSPATAITSPNQASQRGTRRKNSAGTDTSATSSPNAVAKPTPPNRNVRKCSILVAAKDALTSGTESTQPHTAEIASALAAANPPNC